MGLMERIDAAANRDIELIRTNTESKCAAILSAAKEEADRIMSEGARAADNGKKKEIMIAESEARLRAQADENRAIESLLAEFRENVFDALHSAWMSDFAGMLTDTCIYGAYAVGSDKIGVSLIHGYRDAYNSCADRIISSLASRGVHITGVAFDLAARGGAVIRSADGRRLRTETFEESFRRIEERTRIEFIERFCHA